MKSSLVELKSSIESTAPAVTNGLQKTASSAQYPMYFETRDMRHVVSLLWTISKLTMSADQASDLTLSI